MSTVTTLRSTFPSRAWKDAFVSYLTQQLPDLNPDAADEASDSAYLTSRQFKPEVAARDWIANVMNGGTDDGGRSSRSA